MRIDCISVLLLTWRTQWRSLLLFDSISEEPIIGFLVPEFGCSWLLLFILKSPVLVDPTSKTLKLIYKLSGLKQLYGVIAVAKTILI